MKPLAKSFAIAKEAAISDMMDALEARDLPAALKAVKYGAPVDLTGINGNTALHLAALSGQVELAEAFIKQGISLEKKNDDGNTALMYAASAGCADVVRVLLDAGADANAENNNGRNAQQWAEDNGRTEAAQLLQAVPEERAAAEAEAAVNTSHQRAVARQHTLREAARNRPKLTFGVRP